MGPSLYQLSFDMELRRRHLEIFVLSIVSSFCHAQTGPIGALGLTLPMIPPPVMRVGTLGLENQFVALTGTSPSAGFAGGFQVDSSPVQAGATNAGSWVTYFVHASIDPDQNPTNSGARAVYSIYPCLRQLPSGSFNPSTISGYVSNRSVTELQNSASTRPVMVRESLIIEHLEDVSRTLSSPEAIRGPDRVKAYAQPMGGPGETRTWLRNPAFWNSYTPNAGDPSPSTNWPGPVSGPPAPNWAIDWNALAWRAINSQLAEALPDQAPDLSRTLRYATISLTIQAVAIRAQGFGSLSPSGANPNRILWAADPMAVTNLVGIDPNGGLTEEVPPRNLTPLSNLGPPDFVVSLPVTVVIHIAPPSGLDDLVLTIPMPKLNGIAIPDMFVGERGLSARIYMPAPIDKDEYLRVIAVPVTGGSYVTAFANRIDFGDETVWEYSVPTNATSGLIYLGLLPGPPYTYLEPLPAYNWQGGCGLVALLPQGLMDGLPILP